MAAGRIVLASRMPCLDLNGTPVSGALLKLYTNETTTLSSIYSDEALSVALTNPVAADSAGNWPDMWAEAGTDETPTLYSVALTDASGVPIVTYDNFRPSLDYDTATYALASAAATASEIAQTAAEAALADVLAVQALGDDAAAIAARAAKAANLSDLADVAEARTNIGADLLTNVNYVPATTTPATRNGQLKLREQPISAADSAAATDKLKIEDASKSAMNGVGYAFIPPGAYSYDIEPLDISEEMRGKPVTILGSGTGEPFVSAALQEGTRILGLDAATPTVNLKHKTAQQGAGSVDFGKMYMRGTKNTLVPVMKVEGLQGINHIHDLGIVQLGAGDGVHMGNLTTSTFDNNHILGATWSSSGSGVARTGTGFKLELDQDNGLGLLHKVTSRGWTLAYQFGGATGLRPLGYRASMCESSVSTNGFNIGAVCEGFHLDQPYVEATYGYAVKDEGEATLITNPYIVLDFTTGIEFRGTGGTVVGGYIGLATTGSKGVVIGATSGGASIFGTQFIWGGGSSGTNVGHGIHIEAQADPVVNLFPDFRGNWTGTGTSARLLDESYSSVHGGSGGGIGSGVYGFLYRRSAGTATRIPCLSRGALNLHVDSDVLNAGDINGSGTLALSNASVQQLSLAATATTIVRFSAPNLPDKTGILLITNGYARIDPSVYILGITVPIILAAGERCAIHYQNTPSANGVITITSVLRDKTQIYTVATLPAAATAGSGYRAFVSDATAPTFGATVAGGGAVATPVYSDGAAWKVG